MFWPFECVWPFSPETMRKLCLSTKFRHQKIRGKYCILRSDFKCISKVFSTIYHKAVTSNRHYSAKKFTFRKITGPLHVTLLTGESLIYVFQDGLRVALGQSSCDQCFLLSMNTGTGNNFYKRNQCISYYV